MPGLAANAHDLLGQPRGPARPWGTRWAADWALVLLVPLVWLCHGLPGPYPIAAARLGRGVLRFWTQAARRGTQLRTTQSRNSLPSTLVSIPPREALPGMLASEGHVDVHRVPQRLRRVQLLHPDGGSVAERVDGVVVGHRRVAEHRPPEANVDCVGLSAMASCTSGTVREPPPTSGVVVGGIRRDR